MSEDRLFGFSESIPGQLAIGCETQSQALVRDILYGSDRMTRPMTLAEKLVAERETVDAR